MKYIHRILSVTNIINVTEEEQMNCWNINCWQQTMQHNHRTANTQNTRPTAHVPQSMGVKLGVWYMADVWVQRVEFNPAYGISDSRGCGNECDRDSWNLDITRVQFATLLLSFRMHALQKYSELRDADCYTANWKSHIRRPIVSMQNVFLFICKLFYDGVRRMIEWQWRMNGKLSAGRQ
jgi:hypothetical protein